jgi:hypothetical protein
VKICSRPRWTLEGGPFAREYQDHPPCPRKTKHGRTPVSLRVMQVIESLSESSHRCSQLSPETLLPLLDVLFASKELVHGRIPNP